MRPIGAPLRALRLATAGLAVATAGCNTVTPFGSINTISSGGQNYVAGVGSQLFPATDRLAEQARAVLDNDLNVRSVTQRRDRDAIVLEGTDFKGHRAVIHLRPESDGTKVRVHARFGLFGDEALSRAFLDRLATRVGPADGDVRPAAATGEASPPLTLRANSAAAPPGTVFQRRLEGGARELPDP